MDPRMQIELFKFLLTIITGFVLVMLVVILWKKKDEIRAFFWPGSWAEIEMLELDNNTKIWLQKKNDSLTFKFNSGIYYMYEPGTKEVMAEELDEQGNVKKDEQGNPIMVKKKAPLPVRQPSIYRSGRLAKFFYIEGNENPLDFRNNTITGNPQINEEMLKVESSRMITSAGGLGQELMAKYGFFILLGIGFLLLILAFALFRNQEMAKQAAQNTAQLAARGG